MFFKKILFIAPLFLCFFIFSGCLRPLSKIYTISDSMIPTEDLAKSEVGKIIRKACRERGWTATRINSGAMFATYSKKNLMAKVKITYSADTYSIVYADSEGFHYSEERKGIHARYNLWVRNLNRIIHARLAER